MPGVCSNMRTSADSGADTKASASISPPSSATTAGVGGSRCSFICAGSILFALNSLSIRLAAPLPCAPIFKRNGTSCGNRSSVSLDVVRRAASVR